MVILTSKQSTEGLGRPGLAPERGRLLQSANECPNPGGPGSQKAGPSLLITEGLLGWGGQEAQADKRKVGGLVQPGRRTLVPGDKLTISTEGRS